jgi:predicted RNA-binding Zn ribbon-like protein
MAPERWSWLGEPLAIDFANTVRRRGDAYEELLAVPADLAEWAAHEAVEIGSPAAGRLAEVRAARDAVFALLLAATRGETPPSGAERALNRVLAAVPLTPRLHQGVVTLVAPPGADPLDELLARAAASALALLDDPALGFCDAPSCGQFFLRHRTDQRWCGPACGTRARVARHASRSHAVHSASSTARPGTPGADTA